MRLTYSGPLRVETVVGFPPLRDEVLRAHGSATDEELLSRARAGDAEAFRVIFDRQAPGVRRFLGDLLRDESARAHFRLSTLSEAGKMQGWLFGIARMVFLESLRRKRREAPVADEAEPRQIDRAPTPEAALLGREADRVLDQALAGLSEERRAALLMRLDHGLGYDEIASAMGWKLQKVKNEIHRARLQLRAQLAEFLE